MKTLDEINKLLFGDKEAKAAHDEARENNICPAPAKPEPGLIEQFAVLRNELEQLRYHLFAQHDRPRHGSDYWYWLKAKRPPIHGPVPKWFYQGRFKRELVWLWKARWRWHDRLVFALRDWRTTYACPVCQGTGAYDAASLGPAVPCENCDQTGRLCNGCRRSSGSSRSYCNLCG